MTVPEKIISGNFSALAYDGINNNIAVFDFEKRLIRVLSADDSCELYTVNGNPLSIAFDIYGRIVFCDADLHCAVRNDFYGPVSFGAEFEGKMTNPRSILIHSCGAYFMLGEKRLYCVIPEGRGLLDASGRDICLDAMCLTADERGILFIRKSDKRIIYSEFTLEGKLGIDRTLVFADAFETDNPQYICTDNNGNIYCAADSNLYIFNRFGTKTGSIKFGGVIRGIVSPPENDMIYFTLDDGVYSLGVNG